MTARTRTTLVHHPWGENNRRKKYQSWNISLYWKSPHFRSSAIQRIFFVLAEEDQDSPWKKCSCLINLSRELVVHLLNIWEPEGAGGSSGWEEYLSLKGEHCSEDGVGTWDISTRKEKEKVEIYVKTNVLEGLGRREDKVKNVAVEEMMRHKWLSENRKFQWVNQTLMTEK